MAYSGIHDGCPLHGVATDSSYRGGRIYGVAAPDPHWSGCICKTLQCVEEGHDWTWGRGMDHLETKRWMSCDRCGLSVNFPTETEPAPRRADP